MVFGVDDYPYKDLKSNGKYLHALRLKVKQKIADLI